MTLKLYYSYRTISRVTKYRETIQTFPAVTICNLNPFESGKSSTKTYLNQSLELNNMAPINMSTINKDDKSIDAVRKAMDVLKATALANCTANATIANQVGYSMRLMLISCFFNGIRCSEEDFYSFYTFEYGYCHIFNHLDHHDHGSNRNLKSVSQSGPRSGLQLELFAGDSCIYKNIFEFFTDLIVKHCYFIIKINRLINLILTQI